MSAVAYTEERQHDELYLDVLAWWDAGWSTGEIARRFGIGRGKVIGVVHRVHEADPTALARKPKARCPS